MKSYRMIGLISRSNFDGVIKTTARSHLYTKQKVVPSRVRNRGSTGTVQSLRQSTQIVLYDVVPHHDTALLETSHQDT